MFKFFTGRQPQWLSGYPVYAAPHVGLPCNLNNTQAEENLRYLIDNKADRVDSLSDLLSQFDIDVKTGLLSDDPQPLVNALHQWSGEHWNAFHNKKTANNNHWLESQRRDDDLIYSVIMDTAIVLGDLIVNNRPSYTWATDLDITNINDQMHSARRCVVQAPSALDPSVNVLTDIEHLAVERFHKPDNIRQQTDNTWWRAINDSISGVYEGCHLV